MEKEKSKLWFAAKIKPHTEKKIKDYLLKTGIEHYIPFHTVVVLQNGQRKKKEKPVIPGLAFIYGERSCMLELSISSGFHFSFMRNLETKDLLIVPEKQMKDFMFVLDLSENAIPILNKNLRRGSRVRVIKGELAGIEGELIRIKGHKRVVVRLEGLFSLATAYVPKEFLEVIG